MRESEEAEPSFHIEPKHVKNSMVADYSSGTKNLNLMVTGNSTEECIEMFDYLLQKVEELKI